MILTCPECATSYFVDDARIPAGGRSVKCSNCGARWTAMPQTEAAPTPAAAPKPVAASEPFRADDPFIGDLEVMDPAEAEVEAAPPARKTRPAKPVKAGKEAGGKLTVWLCAALAAALVVGGALVFRDAVVRHFPSAQAAYAGLGLPVNGLSLAIENVKALPTYEGGRPVLAVTGSIRNDGDHGATAPPLRISLLDRTGKAVAAKLARPLDAQIPGKATRHFAITIADPPASVHDLEVAFEAPAKGAARPDPAHPPVKAALSPPAAQPAPTPAGGAPGPEDAKPLPAGTPDALPNHG